MKTIKKLQSGHLLILLQKSALFVFLTMPRIYKKKETHQGLGLSNARFGWNWESVISSCRFWPETHILQIALLDVSCSFFKTLSQHLKKACTDLLSAISLWVCPLLNIVRRLAQFVRSCKYWIFFTSEYSSLVAHP